ncbi:hypothetical protein MHBO_004409 [Bonamia ostreae]|uniref:Uncharacterized protein n=1 Tax=Bonamia ostreae TaxID=126728 RepID=A0ABV2AT89_9EUKA
MILAKKAKLSFNNNDDFLEKLAEKSDSVFSEAEKLFSNSQNGPTTEEKFETDFSKLFDKIIPILKNFKNDSLVLAKVINLLSKGFNRCLKLYRNDSKKVLN